MTKEIKPITKEHFEAVLFDLDGVLTATAKVHAACWKKMFDAFLEQWARKTGKSYEPFDPVTDYKLYVDGKLRQDGVRSFLKSRFIELPEGEADDPPSYETIHGLGNRKDELVKEMLEVEGVELYGDGVNLARYARRQGMKTAVVSASKNCKMALKATNLENLFDVRVDGEVAEQLNLPGKPRPDTYLKAAALLGVSPERAVIVEDAISGVQAGRSGSFGLVVGVDRKGNPEELRRHGADIVVADLSELISE